MYYVVKRVSSLNIIGVVLFCIFDFFSPSNDIIQVGVHHFGSVFLVETQFITTLFFRVVILWWNANITPLDFEVFELVRDFLLIVEGKVGGLLLRCFAGSDASSSGTYFASEVVLHGVVYLISLSDFSVLHDHDHKCQLRTEGSPKGLEV